MLPLAVPSVQDDQESARQSAEFLGQLPEQQDNETAGSILRRVTKVERC